MKCWEWTNIYQFTWDKCKKKTMLSHGTCTECISTIFIMHKKTLSISLYNTVWLNSKKIFWETTSFSFHICNIQFNSHTHSSAIHISNTLNAQGKAKCDFSWRWVWIILMVTLHALHECRMYSHPSLLSGLLTLNMCQHFNQV